MISQTNQYVVCQRCPNKPKLVKSEVDIHFAQFHPERFAEIQEQRRLAQAEYEYQRLTQNYSTYNEVANEGFMEAWEHGIIRAIKLRAEQGYGAPTNPDSYCFGEASRLHLSRSYHNPRGKVKA